MSASKHPVVVGVVTNQPQSVVAEAAAFAKRFEAELVCVYVDASRYLVGSFADGTISSLSINADAEGLVHEEFDASLRDQITLALEGSDVQWSTRILAGAPAQELARLASELDASMIVVGTREPGVRGGLREFLSGSVAVQLAHRQHLPVVVIPLKPVAHDEQLPWDAAHEAV